ncbi:hypothetical protein RHMOL_Rhmol07G0098000 [Rhododendron molle]|uniref:Uncharacterized protein n=1 Tax=Rhododendron molle TaxID=49168 RepID=A0ACC0N0Y8_RHOML|nr:hypothetical protein RHMOL_Rhmol07G0098000 [Rhododendron molle]
MDWGDQPVKPEPNDRKKKTKKGNLHPSNRTPYSTASAPSITDLESPCEPTDCKTPSIAGQSRRRGSTPDQRQHADAQTERTGLLTPGESEAKRGEGTKRGGERREREAEASSLSSSEDGHGNPASPRRHSSSSIKMEVPAAAATAKPLLHTLTFSRAMVANRLFAAIYTCAVLALLYHHALTALSSTTFLSFSLSLAFLFSDFVFGFMWSTTQSFLMRPAHRRVFPENLRKVMREEDFPAMDVFICTADPHKEPPVSVVNTALSVMAYDYPAEKLSVYVSDDGGSDLTLFALVEAAKFGSHWLPFCRRNKVVERCPEAYFGSNYPQSNESKQMKVLII